MEFKEILRLLSTSTEFGVIDDAIAIAHLNKRPESNIKYQGEEPQRIGGMCVILVIDGDFKVEINMESYTVPSQSLVIIPPNTVFRLCEYKGRRGEAYLLFIQPSFLTELNINYAALTLPLGVEKPSPVSVFSREQVDQLRRYFDLLLHCTLFKASPRLDRNIASSVISALIYQVAQFYIKALEIDTRTMAEQSRPSGYVQEFLHLLQIHYMKERSVSFYADKLFISPKYLSLLVKKATGRSASRWIDDRVILEARNLLRYSGKNIQQVAYMLNFSNQSSFGKYFKHLTGQSPTEYQKG